MIYSCCNNDRRTDVEVSAAFNGIDFLEVSDSPGGQIQDMETVLLVHFLKPIVPGSLEAANVVISGGERITGITVLSVIVEYPDSPLSPPDSPMASTGADYPSKVLIVTVSAAGDFSPYTLKLVTGSGDDTPPAGYDRILSSIDFSFKVLCPSDFDCEQSCSCADEPQSPPPINYLAKDYTSFRQLMLDRMAFLAPDWTERHAADEGIALIELLAYAADYMSYRQDAIATEAYLGTARRRISVRRHVRLVDYFLHDGCNSRVWVRVLVRPGVNGVVLKKGDSSDSNSFSRFLTRVKGIPSKSILKLNSPDYQVALDSGAQVFEPMTDTLLYYDHNEIHFYTWGDGNCCLPGGSTCASLLGYYPGLTCGTILILQEVRGPMTGQPEDADPAHCQAVSLTSVTYISDPLYAADYPATYPLYPGNNPLGVPVTQITWAAADALTFPLCISSQQGNEPFENVSVVFGNIVLADNGQSIVDSTTSSLSPSLVPSANPALTPVTVTCGHFAINGFSDEPVIESAPPRYNPMVMQAPLTHAAPLGVATVVSFCTTKTPGVFAKVLPARAAMEWQVPNALPVISLFVPPAPGQDIAIEWTPLRDLLKSGASDRVFVVETESDGRAYLRFGDSVMGERPAPGTRFAAAYRIGNGTSGNIGSGTLAYLATADASVIAAVQDSGAIINPMPATGGTEPETMEHARENAPSAFRTQQRAVIAGDYETLAKVTDNSIQRAACTYRWTGSWRTAFVSVDRLNGAAVDAVFETSLQTGLEPFRMAGQDLAVNGPDYVSLYVEMTICVDADYFVSNVEKALMSVLSDKTLPDGAKGVFHPDNFTFGQTLYLSPLYAAAQAVAGVKSVLITQFRRQSDPLPALPLNGEMVLGMLEIARLENDPNYPEHGVLKLYMQGGK
jgi:hypothetical protein